MKMPPVPVWSRAGALSALSAVLLLAGSAGAQQKGPRITPNFKDADITQLIEAVSAATGKNFIIDPRVRAQVTWLSGASTALTPEQFYQGFLSVLQVHGFIAVPAGNIVKVLPDANMRQIPGSDLPSHVSSTSDDVVTQVIAVSNVSAAQLVPVLRPLMPQNAQMSAVTGANMLIISDRASNVSRMMRIVARIDQSGGSDIDVIPLQSATAADTVRVLSSLVAQGGDAGGPTLHLVADDRSNSVLLSGDPAMRLKIRALIANLDTPLDTGGETLVRYLNYARAEDLAAKLKEQISSNNNAASATNIPNAVVPRAGAPAPTGPAGATTVSLAGGTGTIWADKDTNALIITAPQRTMRALNAVIDKLDIRRAQVVVQAIIVEVSADNTADLGINWIIDGTNSHLAVGGFIEPVGGSSLVDLYNAAKTGTAPSASAVAGTTVAIGRLAATGVNFAAIARALQGDSRTNIISKPTITMRDNEESKIEVAQEVPFLTGQYTANTGNATAFQTIQREQVGTILSVTPQINEGDSVVLKVEVEVSSIAASSQGAVDLITNKRTVKTTVLIPDGGTLVIGGLIEDKATNSEQRVPFLSRIPLVGELFRVRDTSKGKTNLMVFLQPHILHDDREAALETDAKYEYLRDQQRKAGHDSAVLPLAPFQNVEPMPALNQPDLTKPSVRTPSATAPGAAPAPSTAPPASAPPGPASSKKYPIVPAPAATPAPPTSAAPPPPRPGASAADDPNAIAFPGAATDSGEPR
jgi:general secretion pathway protein D